MNLVVYCLLLIEEVFEQTTPYMPSLYVSTVGTEYVQTVLELLKITASP